MPSWIIRPFPISKCDNFSALFIPIADPLGKRKDDGLSSINIAVLIIRINSLPSAAAIIIKLGNADKKVMSNDPACVGPSAPTWPALSIANLTGNFWIATSCTIWSYALWRKVEYIAAKGLNPSVAKPAHIVTACCSAIPTSKNFFGCFCAKISKPVPDAIAAVTATIFSSIDASADKVSPKTCENDFMFVLDKDDPVTTSNLFTPWNLSFDSSAGL